MSRIDDALRRLNGAAPADPRTAPVLDRYATEGPARPIEPKRPPREEHGKVAAFDAGAPRQPEVRPTPSAAPSPAVLQPAAAHPAADHTPVADPLIDYRQILDYTGFAVRSLLRHKLLAVATIVLVVGLTVIGLLIAPKSYHVETKLLAQRNAVMAALSNPGRSVPWDADAPTRAAAETVLRRDNLLALAAETDLLRQWEQRRAPVLRLKDWLIATTTRHTVTPDEKLDSLIGLLEARMKVDAGPVGDGTVIISLDWPDGEMAYKLVQSAQQKFIEARQVAETAAIGESINILQQYSASLRLDVDRTLEELNKTQARERLLEKPRSRVALARPPPASAGPTLAPSLGVPQLGESIDADPDLKKVKTSLDAKRLELSRLEEGRQRQIGDLQTRLAQLKTVYTANNPTVQAVEQNLIAVSQDQPQALRLAGEIEELQADYDKRIADATDAQIKSQLTKRSAAAAAAAVGASVPQESPVTEMTAAVPAKLDASSEFATLRLRSELNQLESVLERTDGARIELAVSQAAFKYRYTIVRPAQEPREPSSPNRRMIILAGVIASLMLALGVVVSKDLLSNCILESWQIERRLGLPVLGTLRTA
jgi:uncharacterized protein involved in exopolysaccharide biosynthesis